MQLFKPSFEGNCYINNYFRLIDTTDCVMCDDRSQMIHREAGKLSCEYEAEVSSWSRVDFGVSFNVSENFLIL